jgi:hypothetical protein
VRRRRLAQRTRDERDQSQDERQVCNDGMMQADTEDPLKRYVRAALELQGFRFDEAQIAEITLHFARIQAMADTIFEQPMPYASEAAPVFRP